MSLRRAAAEDVAVDAEPAETAASAEQQQQQPAKLALDDIAVGQTFDGVVVRCPRRASAHHRRTGGDGRSAADVPCRCAACAYRTPRRRSSGATLMERGPASQVNIVPFGCFVDIGATTDGMVHISQLSNEYSDTVDAVVSKGNKVQVHVLSVDKAGNRISLSMKDPNQEQSQAGDTGADRGPPSPVHSPTRPACQGLQLIGIMMRERLLQLTWRPCIVKGPRNECKILAESATPFGCRLWG